jgi:ABC-2 type transport system permease protein
VNRVRRLGVIVAHELRLVRREPLTIMILLAFPIITIAFLKPAFRPALVQSGFAHANGAEQVVPGQAVMAAFYLVALVTFSFFTEHSWATWDRLRASDASSLEIVLGKSVPRIAMGIAQLALLLVAGVLIFDLHIRGSAIALGPPIVAFAVCLVLLGVCVTALCRTVQQANGFAFLGMVLFGAIGGAFVPLAVLPGWARAIAPATPTYWAMRAMHSVVLDGRGINATLRPTLMLLALGTLFAAIAVWRLRFDESKVGFA